MWVRRPERDARPYTLVPKQETGTGVVFQRGQTGYALPVVATDVTPELQRKQDAMWLALSDQARAHAVSEMCRGGRELALVGIRERNPGASTSLERWLLCELLYGQADAVRFLGPRPAA
jgi:hypothetical protein